MKFQLLKKTFQSPGEIDITEKHLNEIATSKQNLIIALGIEEKYNIVLENYKELEQELLGLTLNRLVFEDGSWSGFQTDIYVANRRLANLLSSCRSYGDQLQQNLSHVFGTDSSELTEFKKKFQNEKRDTLGFRAMWALRNHVQHRNFPIHGLSFTNWADPGGENRQVKHGINPTLNIDELKNDLQFDKKLIAILSLTGTNVPLMPLVREYIEAVARIHMTVRQSFVHRRACLVVERQPLPLGQIVHRYAQLGLVLSR